MKQWWKRRIAQKLQHYKVSINLPDSTLPEKLHSPKSVAVVGGGIAGISAAANLAERGFQVKLFEKAPFLGGKLGSWQFTSKGETLRTEHGFHAFFKQYYNLLAFMEKIGSSSYLIPIDDYLILYPDKTQQSFKGIDNTPFFNVLSMANLGVVRYRDMLLNRYDWQLTQLFRYHETKTFAKYDHLPLSEFIRITKVPVKMQRILASFARAFFAEPKDMSTAELMKSFHFYFLSNDLGLLYDVLNDDFEYTFLQPAKIFIEKLGGRIFLNQAVDAIELHADSFIVLGEKFDYCVLATDVKHLPSIVRNSPSLHRFTKFYTQTTSLKPSARYAVWRIWTNKFEAKKYPYFIFTERLKCLDSISLYHLLEKESAAWSKKNNGGIFELHSYALPDDLTAESEIKQHLLQELCHYLPELKGAEIRHEFFQLRDDFSAFHTGLYAQRPTVTTEVPGLYLAGDWVKLNHPSMLMEAAYTSGALAANCIFSSENLRENLLFSVPAKGLFA
jgi:isorenieratene synthase